MSTTIPPLASCCLLLCFACESGSEHQSLNQAICAVETDGSFDENADGIADQTMRNFFNEEGRLERQEFDTNGDSGMDEYAMHLYNDEGANFRSARYRMASDELLSQQERVFDEQGRVVLATDDRNADGVLAVTELTIYDESGRFVRRTDDWNGDGDADLVIETHYGPFGVVEHVEYSPNREFGYERRSLYTYNDRGLAELVEEFLDGKLVSKSEHRYNEFGQTSRTRATRDGEQSVRTYSHDERGFIAGWVLDRDLDGTIDGSAVCVFNDEGRMLSEDVDSDNDGVIDYAFAIGFDEQGREAQEITDEDGDTGEAKRIVTYRYECD